MQEEDDFVTSDIPDDIKEQIDVDFIPPMPSGNSGYKPSTPSAQNAAKLGISLDDVATGINIVSDFADAVSNKDIQKLANLLNENFNVEYDPTTIAGATAIYKVGKAVVEQFANGSNKSGRDGGPPIEVVDSPELKNNALGHHPYRLDYNNVPIEERLNTGITPNCYSPLYHDYVSNYVSPLHLTGAKLQLPSDSTQKLYDYLNKVTTFTFQNKVQGAVAFSVDLTTLSFANLYTALNSLLDALQIYYFYDSVLQYGNNPNNRNSGMYALRQSITADNINTLYELRRILAGIPIPPNMLSIAFYLMQNFVGSSLPGAPVIKMVPVAMNSWTLDNTSIATALANLTTDTNRKVFALLSRAVPNWITNNMPGNSTVAIHDPHFTTIWRNLPTIHQNSTTNVYAYYRPLVTSDSDEIKYNTETNTLDGGAYGLMTAYKGGSRIPSLITTVDSNTTGTYITNKMSWVGTRFDHLYVNVNLSTQRNETNWMTSTAITSLVVNDIVQADIGCETVYGVTANTITQTAYQLLDWMMSFDTIKKRVNKFEGDDKGKGKRKQKKYKK